jgi:hypothetical protein
VADGKGDGGDYEAQEALAVGKGRGVGVPERRQVGGQPSHLLRLKVVEGAELGPAQTLILRLEPRHL